MADSDPRVTTNEPRQERWRSLQPWLVILLIVVLVTVITLLLLQSAGTIDLHFLGSNGSNGALSRR